MTKSSYRKMLKSIVLKKKKKNTIVPSTHALCKDKSHASMPDTIVKFIKISE